MKSKADMVFVALCFFLNAQAGDFLSQQERLEIAQLKKERNQLKMDLQKIEARALTNEETRRFLNVRLESVNEEITHAKSIRQNNEVRKPFSELSKNKLILECPLYEKLQVIKNFKNKCAELQKNLYKRQEVILLLLENNTDALMAYPVAHS